MQVHPGLLAGSLPASTNSFPPLSPGEQPLEPLHLGDAEAAWPLLSQAAGLLARSEARWAVANLQGVIGEVLRDLGRLGEASEAYGSAIPLYEHLDMQGTVAYYRILRAEVLMFAGREKEARRELLAAIPVLEREGLVPDALAAIALLRESLRRRTCSPEALKELKLHIQKTGEGEQ